MRRILFAALTIALAVGTPAAQSLPSVFIYYTSKGGEQANWAAFTLEGLLLSDLAKQYPCIDLADEQAVKAMLDFERMRDLLGADPTAEQLAQIGGAIGARYVVTVKAIQLGNGTVYLSVTVMDTKTAKMVATRDTPPTDPKNIQSSIDSVKNQILGDLAGFLGGKCDEHWTGSISFDYKYEKNETKNSSGIASIADYANAKTTSENNEKATDLVSVSLQPMSLGMNGALRPKARVTRAFEYHRLVRYETTMQVRCRPRGANSYLRNTVDKRSEMMFESGSANTITGVYIYIFEDGRYQIRIDKIPDVTTKWTREDNEQRPGGCEDPPAVISNSAGENSVWAGAYKHAGADIEGWVDPKHPDLLSGTLTLGNETAGIQTIKWGLRRVRPASRVNK